MSFIHALEFTQSMVTAAREKLASPTPLKSNGELVKSNRNSLGLNQEAVCNTLNSREIISDSIL
ncbi:hypothetical protein Tsp_02899, partial [Trichinella spiralis]|uniref:hypothetical protein n=1 Tax=Trichinella spiralis TaxID=6334 RepID=UPI0001EFCB94